MSHEVDLISRRAKESPDGANSYVLPSVGGKYNDSGHRSRRIPSPPLSDGPEASVMRPYYGEPTPPQSVEYSSTSELGEGKTLPDEVIARITREITEQVKMALLDSTNSNTEHSMAEAVQDLNSDANQPNSEPMAKANDFTLSNIEPGPIDSRWGVLFYDGLIPTPRLGQFLRGLATYLIDYYDPRRSLVITPEKMSSFYTDYSVEGEVYQLIRIFEFQPYNLLSALYEDLRCQHHLIQADNPGRPEIPCLTPEGFAHWMTLWIMAYPDQEAKRLRKIVESIPLSADGENIGGRSECLPRYISRHLFPIKEDPKSKKEIYSAIFPFLDRLGISEAPKQLATSPTTLQQNLKPRSERKPIKLVPARSQSKGLEKDQVLSRKSPLYVSTTNEPINIEQVHQLYTARSENTTFYTGKLAAASSAMPKKTYSTGHDPRTDEPSSDHHISNVRKESNADEIGKIEDDTDRGTDYINYSGVSECSVVGTLLKDSEEAAEGPPPSHVSSTESSKAAFSMGLVPDNTELPDISSDKLDRLEADDQSRQNFVVSHAWRVRTLFESLSKETLSFRNSCFSRALEIVDGPRYELSNGTKRLLWKCNCGYVSNEIFKECKNGAVIDFANELMESGYITHAQISNRSSGRIPILDMKIGNLFLGIINRISRLRSSLLPLSVKPTAVQETVSRCVPPRICHWLHLCFKRRPYATELRPLHVCKDHDQNDLTDASFFQALRIAYHKRRNWKERLLFKLRRIEFIKFEAYPNDYVDHITPNELPPSTDEYDFIPPPPLTVVPPISADHMMHLFNECSSASTNSVSKFYLKRIPRKKVEPLSFKPEQANGNIGWGLHFIEILNTPLAVTVMFFASLGAGLVFAIAWIVLKMDVQGAFEVWAYITSLATLAVMTWQMWEYVPRDS